jgi:hypothetical protein
MWSPSSLHPTLRSVPLDPASESTTDVTAESAAADPVPAEGLARLPRFESPLSRWIEIWQRQLVYGGA